MSVTPAQSDPTAERACHDLLVRLAGRLPERLLWRLRDWLAAGAHPALVRSLPKALLRHRIGLTDAERELMEVCLPRWGAPSRLLDAVLPASDPVEVNASFQADLGPGEECADVATLAGWRDGVDLMLAAVVRGHPGAKELRRSWRVDRPRPQRIVLAHVTENLPALTGVMQRILRAHGDLTPAVEVVSPPLALPPYHRLALRESVSLWRSPDREPVARGRRGSTGALVDA
ncbi:hypothetical protein [Pseudonocardia acaciae]|uniref:hypothetical protein n=1 Tax=Pseudonocardia acaciae TaxID=551276 RepID=UPI00068733B8|nr:hypothetical protein [Pseudonocardia acaciae]